MEMISKEEIASYKKSDSYQQLRTGMYVTLYMDDERRVTDYTWFDVQRPQEILKGVPKFNLIL